MKLVTCPKCECTSGYDWSQCGGSCPMPGSPHFTLDAFTSPAPLVPERITEALQSLAKALVELAEHAQHLDGEFSNALGIVTQFIEGSGPQPTDAQLDQLLLDLSHYGMSVNEYDYGLPVHLETTLAEMRTIIREAL